MRFFRPVDWANVINYAGAFRTIPTTHPHVLPRCLVIYLYINIYIYVCVLRATIVDKNWRCIVERGMETVNNYCTEHNVLLCQFHSFLRRNRVPVSCVPAFAFHPPPPPSSSTVGQIGCRNIDFFRLSLACIRMTLVIKWIFFNFIFLTRIFKKYIILK